jgi:hypothetical protein
MINRTSVIHHTTPHHIQSLGPSTGQTVHSPSNETTAVTRQFPSQGTQSKPQKPRPLTCAGTQVGTGRDWRVRTPSADCSELGSRQRRHQPHYLSSTISPAAAMQRLGASTLYRPSPLLGYAKTEDYLRAKMEYLHQQLQRTPLKHVPPASATTDRSSWFIY